MKSFTTTLSFLLQLLFGTIYVSAFSSSSSSISKKSMFHLPKTSSNYNHHHHHLSVLSSSSSDDDENSSTNENDDKVPSEPSPMDALMEIPEMAQLLQSDKMKECMQLMLEGGGQEALERKMEEDPEIKEMAMMLMEILNNNNGD
mmetsp:Transcript_7632/g.8714  ORF Transcript_7632/g.8714 Transcript_7632/m.8714 type:complete len:145 (-) Transcript_7632:59-493(-)|eukprot:CAMPEP_0194145920 /NCGR_PEP_ID=MMETSP0152-20130528/18914_1 /TAXON_ID=1049557 /ORGANISM="Thalassiothrix antarctica, Strain L6-D1" /LENGTH=144 /DNA_ID=CAMNT_0038846291 /DNA_START=74 /DNA_END=508 /DNA_ORIENTATION=-